jgi:predicted dehydrogenase
VAIVGQGRSGHNIHAASISLVPRMFQIAAVADPGKAQRNRAADSYGCAAYADYHRMLQRDDLDLVVNASPSHLHVPIALEALRAGHNVLVEKPAAKTVKQMNQMIRTANKAGKMLTAFQSGRINPVYQQMCKVARSGVLGRITQISITYGGFSRRWDWQTRTDMMGGSLLNTGPHPLDQALRFIDLPTDIVPEVFCHLDRTHMFGDAEGHVHLVMRHPGYPLACVQIFTDDAYHGPRYKLYGTQGGLQATGSQVEWRYYKPRENPRHRVIRRSIATPDGIPASCNENLKWYERKWTIPKSTPSHNHLVARYIYGNIHRHLTAGEPLLITCDHVRQLTAVIEASHRQNPHIWRKSTPRKASKR